MPVKWPWVATNGRDDGNSPDGSDDFTLRSVSGVVFTVVASAGSLFLLVDSAVRGYPGEALRTLPALAAVCWFFYLLFARPSLTLSHDGVKVVNPLRLHAIPWPAVETIRPRPIVTVVLTQGGKITSWGAPSKGVAKSIARERAEDDGRIPTAGHAAEAMAYSELQSRFDPRGDFDHKEVPGQDTTVVSGWDRFAVLGTVAALVLGIVAFLVA